MEEKAVDVTAAVVAVAADHDGAVYCSEYTYPPGAIAAAKAGTGDIRAFYLWEKLGMRVSSSKYSPFHPSPPLPLYPSAASSMTPAQAARELRCGRPLELHHGRPAASSVALLLAGELRRVPACGWACSAMGGQVSSAALLTSGVL
jgi:hypothetical protein